MNIFNQYELANHYYDLTDYIDKNIYKFKRNGKYLQENWKIGVGIAAVVGLLTWLITWFFNKNKKEKKDNKKTLESIKTKKEEVKKKEEEINKSFDNVDENKQNEMAGTVLAVQTLIKNPDKTADQITDQDIINSSSNMETSSLSTLKVEEKIKSSPNDPKIIKATKTKIKEPTIQKTANEIKQIQNEEKKIDENINKNINNAVNLLDKTNKSIEKIEDNIEEYKKRFPPLSIPNYTENSKITIDNLIDFNKSISNYDESKLQALELIQPVFDSNKNLFLVLQVGTINLMIFLLEVYTKNIELLSNQDKKIEFLNDLYKIITIILVNWDNTIIFISDIFYNLFINNKEFPSNISFNKSTLAAVINDINSIIKKYQTDDFHEIKISDIDTGFQNYFLTCFKSTSSQSISDLDIADFNKYHQELLKKMNEKFNSITNNKDDFINNKSSVISTFISSLTNFNVAFEILSNMMNSQIRKLELKINNRLKELYEYNININNLQRHRISNNIVERELFKVATYAIGKFYNENFLNSAKNNKNSSISQEEIDQCKPKTLPNWPIIEYEKLQNPEVKEYGFGIWQIIQDKIEKAIKIWNSKSNTLKIIDKNINVDQLEDKFLNWTYIYKIKKIKDYCINKYKSNENINFNDILELLKESIDKSKLNNLEKTQFEYVDKDNLKFINGTLLARDNSEYAKEFKEFINNDQINDFIAVYNTSINNINFLNESNDNMKEIENIKNKHNEEINKLNSYKSK